MDINIIAGRSNQINNDYIFSLLKNRDKSKNHIIIAPDRSQFSIEQKLFSETGEKCFFDINVISLSRLSKKYLTGTSKKILSKQSGVAVVKRILEQNRDSLVAFKKATSFIGFASSLFETICFYKSCNVSPEQIYVDDSSSIANLKHKDIKFVYTEYDKYLQNEYTDSFNQLKVFADLIDKNTFSNTIFYFLEFEDFTRIMYEIILKLAKFSDGVYLSCTYGKNSANSNIYNHKVYYDLIELFKSDGLDYKITKLVAYKKDNINKLSEQVLSYSPKEIDDKNISITIDSFNNIYDEVKFVVADIYGKVKDKSLGFDDFAIVLPSLSDYKTLLIDELSKYTIPFYIDESKSLIDNYIIRLFFDICKIIEGDYKYTDFSSVIKSPLLGFADDILEYDSYLQKIGAVSDMCISRVEKMPDELKEFVSIIKSIKENKSQRKVSTYIEELEQLFYYILNRSIGFREGLSVVEKRVFDQVPNKFESINRDFVGVFGNIEMDFAEFLEIYKAYFESTSISMPPITSNTLFIADFNASYITNKDYLYVLGNNDGKLPKQKLDNGLVTDEELARLPNAKRLTPTVAMLNARKVFKLFELIFKFEKELVLTYPLNNMEGKLFANNFTNSISKILKIEPKNCSGFLSVIDFNNRELDSNNIVFNNFNREILSNNLIKYLTQWDIYNEFESYRKLIASMYYFADEKTKNFIAQINALPEKKMLDKNDFFVSGNTSVSQLECFNKCPYMHFVKYGLRLEESNNNEIKQVDIGNILHEVLSFVVPKIIALNYDKEQVQTLGAKCLTQVLGKEQYCDRKDNVENVYVVKSLFKELDRILDAICDEIASSAFKPLYCEYKFDKILNVDGVNLKGFIDRIDATQDGFVVIDYKTGDNSFKNFNDVLSGKKLQLLVYAKAFEDKQKLSAKGAFYLPISNKFGQEDSYRFSGVMLRDESNILSLDCNLSQENYKSKTLNLKTTSTGKLYSSSYYKNLCLEKEDFDYLLDFAMKQVKKSISRIKTGDITPFPLEESGKRTCDYCSFKAMCGYANNNDNHVQDVANIQKLKELGEGCGKV